MIAPRLVCLIAFVFVFSFSGSFLIKMTGLPNLIPLFRDFLLMILAFSALSRLKYKENILFYGVIISIVVVLIVNIFIAMVENHQIQGLYYARVYALPVLFAMACKGWICSAERKEQEKIATLSYVLGNTILLIAIPLYIAIQIDKSLLSMLTGEDISQLPTAWFIAGGWIRMGLPMTAPNHLGLVVALLLVFLASLRLSGLASFLRLRFIKTSFILVGIVLALTFSRSGWLAALSGIFMLLLVCRREWNINILFMMRFTTMITIGIVSLSVLLYFVDDYSEGLIAKWVSMNLAGKDPSMQGHGNSFIEAWKGLDEYYLHGYSRGSVGPRALVAKEDMKNVENTLFIIFYDMGLLIGTAFIVLSCLVLGCLFRHPSQIAMLAVFFTGGIFLPYVQAPEIIVIFLFFYSMQGCLFDKTKFKKDSEILNEEYGKYRMKNSRRKI